MLQNIQHFQDVNDTFYDCFSVNADYVKTYVKKMASKNFKNSNICAYTNKLHNFAMNLIK